ncbi:MAG TPA: hypothetical protein VN843_26135, partial [Anaerolineales bacterium]|nr:hypothetical protein [Anaerolineales bacterium]
HLYELGVAHGRTERAANRPERPVRVAVHRRKDRIPIDGYISHEKIGRQGFCHRAKASISKFVG